ncbi:ATP-binding protein [Nocardia sp. NPDC051321]|uniref:ATP-binding protein n=1 Tax=Nocardia sp. NPDC051321 TaxID=3364323 RepID=UPI0037B873CF
MNTERAIEWNKAELAGSFVLRPVGELSASNYRVCTDELTKYALEQPRSLIVVVDRLRIGSEPLLTAFSSVAMRVNTWPGTPLLLVCGSAPRRERLRTGAISRFVPVLESVAAALRAAHAPKTHHRVTLEIAATAGAAQRARRLISEVCTAWRLAQVRVPALLVGTELVDNAYRHARGTDDLRLRLELANGMLTVAVYDSDPREAVLSEPGTRDAREGGLHRIARMSVAWGCAPRWPIGKVVWAALAIDEPGATLRLRGTRR